MIDTYYDDKTIIAAAEENHIHIIPEPDITVMYDDMLNDCYDFSCVGSLFATVLPSTILQNHDPVAYDTGYNDFLDSIFEEHTELLSGAYFIRDDDLQNLIDILDCENEEPEE